MSLASYYHDDTPIGHPIADPVGDDHARVLAALCALEPRLYALLADATAWGVWPVGTIEDAYERCKRRFAELVGWNACHPALATTTAYETIARAVSDRLERPQR